MKPADELQFATGTGITAALIVLNSASQSTNMSIIARWTGTAPPIVFVHSCDVATTDSVPKRIAPIVSGRETMSADLAELEAIFYGLAKIWKDSTGGLSNTSRRFSHPTYRAILRLGPQTVPLILKELQQRPDWWFDALEFLTNDNPTQPTDSFEDATAAWVKWGREHNCIR